MTKIEIYQWFFKVFKKNPNGLTFRELSTQWEINFPSDVKPLNVRTFHRYKQVIADLFNVHIVCRRVGEVYKYSIEGLDRVDVDSFILHGQPLPQPKCINDDDTIRILVDLNAYAWMQSLLANTKYEIYEFNKGKFLFEFRADITEAFARSLLPFADSFVIKRPSELVDKVYHLVCDSRHRIMEYNKRLPGFR